MKHLIVLSISIILGCTTMFAKGPLMEIKEASHDFGTIQESNGYVSHEFEFVNAGDEPLIIISARANCGCTVPKYPKQPIRPGEAGKIKVTYNPAGRPGEFNKVVRIKTNAKGKMSVVRISGVVIPKK